MSFGSGLVSRPLGLEGVSLAGSSGKGDQNKLSADTHCHDCLYTAELAADLHQSYGFGLFLVFLELDKIGAN